MPKQLKSNGFGLVSAFIVIVVIAAIGLSGWAVYRHEHKTKTVVATKTVATSKTNQTSSTKKTTTQPPANPYAGWKTYCDTLYHYCFQYPTTWQLSVNSTAQSIGSLGQVTLLSPTKAVSIAYTNAFTKDSNSVNFMPTTISKLTAANQAVTLVGGYIPTSGDNGIAGNNIPEYLVVDSSFLTTYPLTIGQLGQFPSNPNFSDQYAADARYNGSLVAKPAIVINTVTQSETWLDSADAKTGVQILESFYYN
jgi:hypothetical protein